MTMTSRVGRVLVLAGVLSTLPAAASAAGDREGDHSGDHHGDARSVPEFDPAAIGAVAALAVGGGVLLARRRKQ